MTRPRKPIDSRLARLAPVVVMGAVIAGFSLLHIRLEVPREWTGWVVLAIVAAPLWVAIPWLASALVQRRRAATQRRERAIDPGNEGTDSQHEPAAPPSADSRRNAG